LWLRIVLEEGKRIKLYRQADRILIEEAVIVPLMYGQRHLLVKPWVRKYPISALGDWF
jgi:ABC-type oligopeptide transport system substrate-binding subunit